MNRSDERKMTGAGVARSPGAARKEEEKHATGHDSREHDEKIGGEDTQGASMARSPSRAKAAEGKAQSEQKSDMGRDREEVSGGRGIKHVHVDADHVMGEGGGVSTASAEGFADNASAGANRKEAMEPEREANEKAAIGREREVAHKNTMGHGERETKAHHTI
jgi:hypothetical protein